MLWRVRSLLPLTVVLVVTLCWNEWHSDAAVISIDFSSEWLKIALVKPGVPMEIVLNKESKRKTAAVVALRNDERVFGEAASSVAIKYPKNAYLYLQLLIGLQYDNPLVEKYKEWFPYYDIRKDEERGTLIFHHDENNDFTPEELLGMLFNHSRELAQDYAATNIRDVIITVPAFYNQAQRRTVLHSAQLVGLNVLQLITDSAAVALNYGLFRQASFNTTPLYIMFYDMGALSTMATIAEYKKTQVREGGVAHIHPQVRIKGVGFDRTLGGLEMEMRLRDHLAKIFTSKHKTSSKITDSPRAMAKLLKEAKRVKKVLSANTEIFAQIEGLFEEIDFKAKVTREELEELCADLYERIDEPVKQALKVADITMGEIDAVILVGGSSRVPKVQEKLLETVKKPDLSKNINADEAAALGAVYQGASLSKLFRVKKFIVKDANIYPIQVSFEKQAVDSEGNLFSKTVTRTLFSSGNPYPQKKVLTFNRYSSDFDFSVFYGDVSFLNEADQKYLGPTNLTTIHLEGVMKAIADNSEGDPSGIKAHFRMDDNGILNLDSVESLFEYPDVEEESTFSKIKSAFSNLFGGSDDGDETKQDEDKQSKESNDKEELNKEGTTKEELKKEDTSKEEVKKEDTSKEEVKKEDTSKEEVKKEDTSNEEVKKKGTSKEEVKKEDTSNEEVKKKGTSKEEVKKENEEVKKEESSKDTQEETYRKQETPTDKETKLDEGKDDDKEKQEDNINKSTKPSQEEQDESEPKDETENKEQTNEEPSEGSDEKLPDSNEEEETLLPDESQNEEEEEEEIGDQATPTESTTSSLLNDSVVASNETTPINETSKSSEKKTKADKSTIKMKTIKVNLTSVVTQLDLSDPTDKQTDFSKTKLQWLQQRDDDKKENERAKNNLESHIFETQDHMYSEEVMMYSTDEERQTILDALKVAGEWLEEDGYEAETELYYQKLRELKRTSRPVFRRLKEARSRPKLIAELMGALNRSYGMLLYMQNLTEEVFTKVEMKTLEDLTFETLKWYKYMIKQQNATKPYEEPVLLSSELEEKTQKVNREVLYLINKIKSYRPKSKSKVNTTNTTSSNRKTKGTYNTTSDNDKTSPPTSPPPIDPESESPNTQIPDKDKTIEEPITPQDDVSEEPEVLGLPSTDSVSDKERQEL